MELSIIVPVYNMEADGKLEYCLNSLLNQSIEDYEIIAVDDASTDNSPQILLEYAANYPDIIKVYFSPENRKQGGAKNIGLKHARGRWIAFVDSDDWVHPSMYEKLLQKAKETGADMVGCNYHLTCEHSERIGQIVRTHYKEQTGKLDEEKRKLLLLDSGSLVIKIYRRKLIYDCGMKFPEHIFYEDNAIANAIIMQAKHFEYIDEPLYYYYQHQSSTVHTITKERCMHRLEAARIMLSHAKENGYLGQYHDEIEYKFTLLFYVNTLFSYLQGTKKRDRDFLAALQKEMEETFPEFEQNPYYRAIVGKEEQMFIHMQQTSTWCMLAYYNLKWFVRNQRNHKLKKILLRCVSPMIGCIGCLGLLAWAERDLRFLEYPIVLMGDSIIANDYPGQEIDEMLEDALQKEVFNAGFGGTALIDTNREGVESNGSESLCLENLVTSIVTGDFRTQKSVIKRVKALDYFEERLEQLSNIDFSKTEVLIIEHGANDFLFQIEPEAFERGLSRVLTLLKETYPKMEIIVSSPTYCYMIQEGEKLYCDNSTMGRYSMDEYVAIEEKICDKLGVSFIDNYHNGEINKQTIDRLSMDGLHLTEEGRRIIADNMLEAIEQMSQ